MRRTETRVSFGVCMVILSLAATSVVLNAPLVHASGGIIYINANGSISPPTAPITTTDNVTYTLVSNTHDEIVVQRDDIIVDGKGYALQGLGNGTGFYLSAVSNVTIKNTTVTGFNYGVWLNSSFDDTLSENNASNNNYGIVLESSSNNTLSGNTMTSNSNIANNGEGIELGYSLNNSILGNNLYSNDYGIAAYYSNDNSISENNITGNDVGIELAFSSSNNEIIGDIIASSSVGIELSYSSNDNDIGENNVTANLNSGITVGYRVPESSAGIYYGGCSGTNIFRNNAMSNGKGINVICSNHTRIFHNSFENNVIQGYVEISQDTNWDNGYPSGGNHWSDYNGTDSDHDGIGDTPYIIDPNNKDNYPLMGTFCEFNVFIDLGKTENVTVISNSTVSNFGFYSWLGSPYDDLQSGQSYLQFNVTGQSGGIGFCRVMIPRTVLNSSSYVVLVDSNIVNATELPVSNSTHVYLYFTYAHSTHEVIVTIPEYVSFLVLPLFMIATLLAVIVYTRKRALLCWENPGRIERWQITGFQQTLKEVAFSNDTLRLHLARLGIQGTQGHQKQMQTPELPPNPKIRIMTIFNHFRDKAARGQSPLHGLGTANSKDVEELDFAKTPRLWSRSNLKIASLLPVNISGKSVSIVVRWVA